VRDPAGVTVGIPGSAGVVLALDLVLNVLLVVLNILPSLDRISTNVTIIRIRQGHGSGTEEKGRGENHLGLGQHFRIS
jgi:hypothetical protein